MAALSAPSTHHLIVLEYPRKREASSGTAPPASLNTIGTPLTQHHSLASPAAACTASLGPFHTVGLRVVALITSPMSYLIASIRGNQRATPSGPNLDTGTRTREHEGHGYDIALVMRKALIKHTCLGVEPALALIPLAIVYHHCEIPATLHR